MDSGIFPAKKMTSIKNKAKVQTDHTLTREFVVMKSKMRHVDTITQWNWDLPCQTRDLEKFEAKVYTDHALTRELAGI